MVSSNVRCSKYRCKLMLCRSNFVMFCFSINTKLPELTVKILHKIRYSLLDIAKIMILQFLSLRSHSTEQSSACKHKIFSLIIVFFVNKEIFLFRTYRCRNSCSCCISEELKDSQSLFIYDFH